MARVLLLLPTATYRAPDFIDAAARLGVEVVVASEHRQALSREMGGRALVVSLRDPARAAQQIAEAAVDLPLDAIVAVDDAGARAAALASARLGLRSNPVEAVARTRDKAAMRDAFAAAGVPQPRYRLLGPGEDAADAGESVGFPCVVKPLSLSGSRGVIRADTPDEARAAAERARRIVAEADDDPDGPLLVESFAAGPEVAVEGLLVDGDLHVLAVFDKPDHPDGPFFEETTYVTPSRLGPEVLERIERATAAAADALGLREGPVHAELRAGDRLAVLELAARSIGGLCARTLRFGLGVSLEELILRHALGMELGHLERERSAAAVMMLPIRTSGKLVAVHGRERALAVPAVGGVEITIPNGGVVRALPEGDRYLGFIFAKADTPERVVDALHEAHRRLDVVIEPRVAATAPA